MASAIVVISGTALAATVTTGAASHAASARTAHAGYAATSNYTGVTKHCYTLITKIHPPGLASHVIARGCSSTAAGAAKAAGAAITQKGLAASSETPLVTFYQNADYTGNSDTVYGNDGPCDPNGYGLGDLSYENDWVVDGISSYQTHSYCWGQEYWNSTYGWSPWTTPCKTYTDTWEVSYVGAACNDKLYSMYLWDNHG
jgi:hypothetical protein